MQHVIRAAKGPIRADLTLPGSKSISLRALMIAALADGVSEISGLLIDDDIRSFIHALHEFGIVTQLDEEGCSCIIAGGNGQLPRKQTTVWCGESNVVAAFLLASSAASSGVYYFDGSPALRTQSMRPILQELHHQGIQVIPNEQSSLPFTLISTDHFVGGNIMANDKNTLAACAMMMIAPYSHQPFLFTILENSQQSMIDITRAIMSDFGVQSQTVHQQQIIIPTQQRYLAQDYTVEPDLALACYFFAGTAITHGELSISSIRRHSYKQSSADIFMLLEKMGCSFHESNQSLHMKAPPKLHGIDVTLPAFKDVFLAITMTAIFADSPTRITHSGNPTPRELTRLRAICQELINMGIEVESGEHWIQISPGSPQSGIMHSHGDKRIAMALSILGLKLPSVIIDGIELVEARYPDFYLMMDMLVDQINAN